MYMKIHLLLVIAFFSFLQVRTIAQDQTDLLVLPNAKFKVGVHYMLNSTFRDLSGNEFITEFKSVEEPRIGYTIGSSIEYDLHQDLSIESGLYFSRKEYGGIQTDSSEFFTRYLFFDVPLQVNWYFYHVKSFELLVGAGGTAHLLLQPFSIERVNNTGEIHRLDLSDNAYNTLSLSARGVLGVNYYLSPMLLIRAQGGMNVGVTPIYDREFTERLYNSFLSVGVVGRF